MNVARGVAIVATLVAATTAALLLPPAELALLAVVGVAARRRSHLATLGFASASVAFSAVVFAVHVNTPGAWATSGWGTWSQDRALLGAVAGLRLSAAVAVNLAVLDRWPAHVLLESLRVPPRPASLLAATALAGHDVGEDARRLALARRLDAPAGRGRRVARAALLLPSLLVLGLRRARTRREALRMAGLDTPAWFTPVVATVALASAGRMAFAAAPNVSPTYAVVFLAGLLFGPAVGALAGALSMALTNLLLSGLLPSAFANVPAMALLGAVGGWMRGVDWEGRTRVARGASAALAGCTGFAATLLFSVVADVATWAITPESWGIPEALRTRILSGLAFNLLPAVTNAILFAAATPLVVGAWARLQVGPAFRSSGTSG